MRHCRADHSFDPARCASCRDYAALAAGAPPSLRRESVEVASSPACLHRGGPTGGLVECSTCAGRVRLKTFGCSLHGPCLPEKSSPGVASCKGCPDALYSPRPLVRRVDRAALARLDGVKAAADARFNPSLFRYKGRLLFAYRTGWEGANVHVAEMSENLVPLKVASLALAHPRANYGREDPRLFEHAGGLHVAYIGVEGVPGGVVTNQMYARLSDDLRVERVFYPHYAGRQAWEKNWQFFSHGGSLYAAYSVSPHKILKVDGDAATLAYETAVAHPWSGGHLRGGSSPLPAGGRFYSWFHGARQVAGWRHYNVGVYCFDAAPPFAVTHMTPHPLAWADLKSKPADVWAAVVFPCGAVLEGGKWRVSLGWHDRHSEVWEYDAAHVDRLLGLGVVPNSQET